MGIQTYESDWSADVDDDNGDYVMPEDEEIARFGETFRGIVTRYLSQYVRGDRSIDTVCGINK
jgi:hypothetical protein